MTDRGKPAGGTADPGLQVERTALAWRRTGFSVLVCGAVGARLLAPHWGPVAWALAAGAAAVCLSAVLHSRRRAVRMERIVRGEATTGPGAGPLLALAAACAVIGVFALLFVILRQLPAPE